MQLNHRPIQGVALPNGTDNYLELNGIDWVEIVMDGWKSCRKHFICFIEKPMSEKGKKIQNFTERLFLLYPGNSRTLPPK